MHQRRRRRRRQHRETWGKKNYFSVFSHSPGLSLLLLFNPPRSTRTLQGLHSGSDKTYDALIIDEDKVRFFVDSLSAASPVFLFSVSLLSLSFLLPLPTLQKKKTQLIAPPSSFTPTFTPKNSKQVVDALEDTLSAGGRVVDFHGCDFFPERWFDLVVVLQAGTAVLWDRLAEGGRGYSEAKVKENVQCEIMHVCVEEARESYR